MYDERMITPMRQELTRHGVVELKTPEDVDAKLKDAKGTTLVVVNSMCGCAARNARPAVTQAIQSPARPDDDRLDFEVARSQPGHRIADAVADRDDDVVVLAVARSRDGVFRGRVD